MISRKIIPGIAAAATLLFTLTFAGRCQGQTTDTWRFNGQRLVVPTSFDRVTRQLDTGSGSYL